MHRQASFAEILTEKMDFPREKVSETKDFSSEPAFLSYLMGQISPLKRPIPNKTYPHKPYIPKPHALNEQQRTAFDFFRSYNIDISEAFTPKDLKTHFRKLALRLHPDHNQGGTEAFRLLKAHFEVLKTVFPKPPENR